jgi:NAD(P)-dependent dehydrogenase (short-subunit alcohol dehydrogenase family)
VTSSTIRTAVVTGGLSGIGLACAKALREQGVRVAIGSRSGNDDEQQAAARTAIGGDIWIEHLDVRDEDSVRSFMTSVADTLGPVDILINSAGVSAHEMISSHGSASWDFVIDTNLSGPFRTIRECLPAMMARGFGRIINIASTAARTATADHGAYCASKSGLVGLTRAVALEGAPHGVTCVAVSPTWVETEMLQASAGVMARATGTSVESQLAQLSEANPQGRLVQADEIGALVKFLCSDAAAALTMEDIQVNAGAWW